MKAAGAWSRPVHLRVAVLLAILTTPGRIDAQMSEDPPAEAPSLEPPVATSLVVRGLSWDISGGGIPRGGGLFEGHLGFSGLPRLAYHHTLRPGLSVGGLVALDLGWWSPERAVRPGLLAAVPIRATLFRDTEWSIGVRGEPGLLFDLKDQLVLGIALPVSLSAGFTLEDRFILGLTVDVPTVLLIPTGGTAALFAVPLLAGPTAEFHVTPPLALTLEAKFGPWLSTDGTDLAVRVLLGATYRL